ncbi:MAG: hypothetical protein HY078_17515 [Elusimicrobia bacterium]|nr:hypothetical protein [Elusimicrobiota bacterium]
MNVLLAAVLCVSAFAAPLFSEPAEGDAVYLKLATELLPDFKRKSQTLAVCPLAYREPELASLAGLVTERVTNALAASKRCVVLERSRLDKVLSEAKLGMTGAISAASAAKIGTLAGANMVVTGSVESDGASLLIILRLVHAESGKVIRVAEAPYPRPSQAAPHEIPAAGTKLYRGHGSCMVRGRQYATMAMFNDPDTGKGYSRKLFPGIIDHHELRRLCTRAVFDKLVQEYLDAGNSSPVTRGIMMYDEDGAFLMTGPAGYGIGTGELGVSKTPPRSR